MVVDFTIMQAETIDTGLQKLDVITLYFFVK